MRAKARRGPLVVDDAAVRMHLVGEIVDEGARLGPVLYLGIAAVMTSMPGTQTSMREMA